jgi:hypothetical protein
MCPQDFTVPFLVSVNHHVYLAGGVTSLNLKPVAHNSLELISIATGGRDVSTSGVHSWNERESFTLFGLCQKQGLGNPLCYPLLPLFDTLFQQHKSELELLRGTLELLRESRSWNFQSRAKRNLAVVLNACSLTMNIREVPVVA